MNPPDLGALSMTDMIRLQNQLQQELTRRFERQMLLVFSDIVASTPYFERFGDVAGRQLQQLHLDLLGTAAQAAAGRVVGTAGDGVFCCFEAADPAIAAAIDFQRQIAASNAGRGRQHQLQVRVGLHWGPVLSDGAVVSGDAVNLCARVAASAEAGEIRLTRAVYQELGRSGRLCCRALGERTLKGVAVPIELLAFDWRDPARFPRRLSIDETAEQLALPQQDIVAFGRLAEHEGVRANDVVLTHPDPAAARLISRWHFELRRLADGLQLRVLSDNGTEVDGTMIGRGHDVPVRAGSRIRVADILTLHLIGAAHAGCADEADSTTMFRTRRPDAAPGR